MRASAVSANTWRAGRAVGAQQIALHRVRGAQPFHHAGGDREEAQPAGDQRFRQHAGQADIAEHDDDHRRDRQHRHRLAGDQPRHQRAIQRAHVHDADRQRDAGDQRDHEAEHGRPRGDAGVVQQAAGRSDADSRTRCGSFRSRPGRRGQQRPVQRQRRLGNVGPVASSSPRSRAWSSSCDRGREPRDGDHHEDAQDGERGSWR